MSNIIGQSLGRYHILEQLGEGGMAIVYKAYDTRLERDVALKVIRTDKLTMDTMERTLKRFEREAKALAKLTHPNIVPITDYGEHEGQPYLVMPYLPGGTLKQRLGKPIAWEESVRLLIPIARALAYAHEQGIIHRDVKPSNILITHSGEPMLTDFGIAKILFSEGETADLTGTGMGIGTPEYMAPEQWTGKAAPQSDQYALGVVLYEMVTGHKPYTADTPAAILIKQANDPLPRPKNYVAGVPDAVEKIILKALAKRVEDRFESMVAFKNALEAAPVSKTETTHVSKSSTQTVVEIARTQETVEPQKPRRNCLIYAAGALALVCLIGVCVLASQFGAIQAALFPPTATATSTPIPFTATPLPTNTLIPTFTSVPSATLPAILDIVGAWSGYHAEVIGDKRSFILELTIYESGADTFTADIQIFYNGALFQTNTAEGDFDGYNIRFTDNDGRHYWGTLQNGHLIGEVAWECYGCNVWGTFDLTRSQ
ncbi:MAG: serine/threonine-protein kinase [Chloroflexota bacterium]